MVNAIELIAYEVESDNIGNQREREVVRKTYCEVSNITMAEFYRAKEQKIGVKYLLIINAFDYRGESHVNFKGKKYKVIRTFTKGDMMELYIGD